MTSTVRVRFIDGATGEMIHVRSRVGRNVLTLADEVGALDIDADDEFCLEGRCGTCSMEKINCDSGFTEDVILACRTCVEEGSDAAYRINRNVRLGDSTWMNG
jgi:ferredoxin